MKAHTSVAGCPVTVTLSFPLGAVGNPPVFLAKAMRFVLGLAAILLLIASSCPLPAATITIDDFEEGPFDFSVDSITGEGAQSQSGLSIASVLSGRRNVVLQAMEAAIPTSGQLILSSGDDGLVLSGDPAAIVAGFRLEYLFSSPQDLTMGGVLDRFSVRVSNVMGNQRVLFNVLTSNAVYAVSADIDSAGITTLAYDDFFLAGATGPGPLEPLDMTQVGELRFVGQASGSLRILELSSVPESSTLGCLALSVVGVAFRRNRKPEQGKRGQPK